MFLYNFNKLSKWSGEGAIYETDW